MIRRMLIWLLALTMLFSMPACLAEDEDFSGDEDFGFEDEEEFEEEEDEVDFRNIAGYPMKDQTIQSGDFVYLLNAEDGTASICGYTGTETDVTIPAALDEHPVVSIENNAFYFSGIESVTMPETMRTLGTMAFSQCASLKKVTLNEGLTQIGDCCFGGDALLAEISMPESLETIGRAAFAACPLLEEVDFGPKLEAIGDQAFYGCAGLVKVSIPESTQFNDTVFEGCAPELEIIRET